jgi:TolB-like protein
MAGNIRCRRGERHRFDGQREVAAMTAQPNIIYEIGQFRIDTRRRLLLSAQDGAPIPLAHKVLEALVFLVEHRGQLLEKSTLISAIWPDVVVEENSLNQVITTLRRVLGERPGEHRFIVTVPGRGYRFVADVEICPAAPEARDTRAASPPGPRPSVAVLPFANLTGDASQEYLCDGIAAELIYMLARAPELRVSSRTSSFAYKGRNVDIRQIGRDLGCTALVEGSVRSAGNRVQVTAQLIDAHSGFHTWSQSYQRSVGELFKLQDELARALVRAVASEARESSLASVSNTQGTHDIEAYRAYLRGSALLRVGPDHRAFRAAIAHFEDAIARDPAFARAHGAAALGYNTLASVFAGPENCRIYLDAAAEYAQRGLALDAGLAEAEHALGLNRAARCQWLDAEKHFRRALSLDDPIGQTMHAVNVTAAVGHLRAALREGQEAYRLSPGSARVSVQLACFYSFLALDSHAMEHVAIAASLGRPEHTLPSNIVLSQAARRAGRYAEAAEHMLRMLPPDMPAPGVPELIRLIFKAMGDTGIRRHVREAMRALFTAHLRALLDTRVPMLLMYCATLLGDVDLAYDIGMSRVEDFERTGVIAVVDFLPGLWPPEQRAFRQDPRFHGFVSRLGLVEYWQEYGPPDDCELRDGRLICP